MSTQVNYRIVKRWYDKKYGLSRYRAEYEIGSNEIWNDLGSKFTKKGAKKLIKSHMSSLRLTPVVYGIEFEVK